MAYMSAVVIGTVRLLSSLLLSDLIKRYRRRSMYFFSAGMVSFALQG